MTANLDLFTPGAVAQFSPCGLHRYLLTREDLGGIGTCLFVMLNPSTADAMINDPTIRRCIGFAKRWGFGRLEVCNAYGWRATDPKALRGLLDPVGADNDRHIRKAAQRADLVVCAWGGKIQPKRAADVLAIIRAAGRVPHCLGLTGGGHPLHPLYLPGGCRPEPFAERTLP